ncbi:unnamed protein product [Periconia digitata]|uniref:Uncharacterized protein n=1 Tax=Periconia digitata TaxID=1303443 RepID=A0A9W4XP04_9PLEO|nr:unnamed protein product [Periconia digitata]
MWSKPLPNHHSLHLCASCFCGAPPSDHGASQRKEKKRREKKKSSSVLQARSANYASKPEPRPLVHSPWQFAQTGRVELRFRQLAASASSFVYFRSRLTILASSHLLAIFAVTLRPSSQLASCIVHRASACSQHPIFSLTNHSLAHPATSIIHPTHAHHPEHGIHLSSPTDFSILLRPAISSPLTQHMSRTRRTHQHPRQNLTLGWERTILSHHHSLVRNSQAHYVYPFFSFVWSCRISLGFPAGQHLPSNNERRKGNSSTFCFLGSTCSPYTLFSTPLTLVPISRRRSAAEEAEQVLVRPLLFLCVLPASLYVFNDLMLYT